ncbi:mitochondrial ribosomal protein L16 [Rickenella mellea]|uniref:Mitochondrial ribosomal protein L16 n=1 Tax=Rickenella mellea TaxID=50990 RepID=A0A4Y7PUX2_9AGAM|nr:mitochondrial ribosomal protein L16 [Rickenella mellea]
MFFPLRPRSSPLPGPSTLTFVRHRTNVAPRKVKWPKRQKGTIPIPTGGSTKGTTLAFGEWGIRIKENGVRFTAKQLVAAEEVIKRKLKPLKGSKLWTRVYPDIPVCVKGNETRMGKGKGAFEFWATRVGTGRVIFEIGGVPIREELARDALRQASSRLPVTMEFISRRTPAKLGSVDVDTDTPHHQRTLPPADATSELTIDPSHTVAEQVATQPHL